MKFKLVYSIFLAIVNLIVVIRGYYFSRELISLKHKVKISPILAAALFADRKKIFPSKHAVHFQLFFTLPFILATIIYLILAIDHFSGQLSFPFTTYGIFYFWAGAVLYYSIGLVVFDCIIKKKYWIF